MNDLGEFLDAELNYYDRCRDVLLQLRRDWPAGQNDIDNRRNPRSRSNTAHAFPNHSYQVEDEPPTLEARPAIRSNRAASAYNPSESPRRELQNYDLNSGRPGINRSTTFEGPTQIHRDCSPVSTARMSRVPSDSLTVRTQRSQLRPAVRSNTGNDLFSDPSDDSTLNSTPDRSYDERSQRSASPATSHGSAPSRSASYSTLNAPAANGKKQAPPPPPSRAKKPPPPPPPMKRSALSTNNVSYA